MFDKFKEEKGGEMMEERIEENVNEEESVEASPNSESTIGLSLIHISEPTRPY